jgi:beta-glucosidase
MPNIDKLVNDLTLNEKVQLLSGFDAWHTNKIDRLNIPSIKMSDGPNGVRGDGNSGQPSACFPSAISLGSTWDMGLINKLGIELGSEAKLKDVDVLLGPTINIHRHPLGGRHFESYSEDPYLTGRIAIEYVNGVQSKNVASCLKHFVGNDTEFQRYAVSSNIDERTLREIYLLPFEMGIKESNAKSVMSAYNKLNNIYCSSHKQLLIDILKKEWNFDGYVVSDWGAALENIENANGGLDLEMPGPAKSWGTNLVQAIERGDVPVSEINDKVKRILNIAVFSKRFDDPDLKAEKSNDTPEQRMLLKKAAQDGMVLLKNEGLLPLNKNISSIGVIGPNAKKSQIIGGGSAHLMAYHESHPLKAIKDILGKTSKINYSKGCHTHRYLPPLKEDLMKDNPSGQDGYLIEYFDTSSGEEELVSKEYSSGGKFWVFEGFAKDIIAEQERPNIFVKFTCTYSPDISGNHEFEIFAIGGSKLLVDGNLVIDNSTETSPGDAFFAFGTTPKRGKCDFKEGEEYKIEIQYKFEGNFPAIYIGCKTPDKVDLLEEAKLVAEESDQVILVVGTNSDWETEGNDRSDLDLPGDQNNLINTVLDINPNTIILLNTGSPISMPWLPKAKAVLQCWYPGQEFGNALVEILTGDVSPSGKLPTTFPMNIKDTPAFNSYPGEDLQMNYEEKLLVGYKWYERKNIGTLFPFGHGLSYTKFEYSDLKITKINDTDFICRYIVKNTGSISGSEISQCYVGNEEADKMEPIKKLQGFCKTHLEPGEHKEIGITLDERSFSNWSVSKNAWVVQNSSHKIYIGASSEDIRLKSEVNL